MPAPAATPDLPRIPPFYYRGFSVRPQANPGRLEEMASDLPGQGSRLVGVGAGEAEPERPGALDPLCLAW